MTVAKINELKEKAQKIQDEIHALENKRNEGYAKIIGKLDFSTIGEEEFVGALLYIKEQASNNNLKEKWQDAGRKFLKRKPKLEAVS
jgi:hypothetical protein